MKSKKAIKYKRTPTAIAFFDCTNDYQAIRGPVGSGKSVQCLQKLMYISCVIQQPDENGIRKTRHAVVRNSYRQLETTTIKTFQDWFPPSLAPMKGKSPITAVMKRKLPDGTTVHIEWLFMSLDTTLDIDNLMSLELTSCYFNESQYLPLEIIEAGYSRTGRYPSTKDGPGATWNGVIMDTNSPAPDHWWYTLEQKIKPAEWTHFIQPPALIDITKIKPQQYTSWMKKCVADKHLHKRVLKKLFIANEHAENVDNLKKQNDANGYRYYFKQITEASDINTVRANILNEYAIVRAGKPVYENSFSQDWHISKDKLIPVKNRPIYAGLDGKRNPAFIIAQEMANGQLRILKEIIGENIGLRLFLKEIAKPILREMGIKPGQIQGWIDPSGVARDSTEDNDLDILTEHGFTHFELAPDKSNNIKLRLESVRYFLGNTVGYGQPMLLLNSVDVTVLNKGFITGYKYKRLQVSGDERYQEKPDKDKHSHPHDALQYLCQGLRGEPEQTETLPGSYADYTTNSNTGY